MNQVLDVVAEKIINGGEALCRNDDGQIIFVRRALAGERVRIEIVGERKHIPVGRVIDVLEPSPERIDPPCPAYKANCGGCQLQHGNASIQHQAKLAMATESLQRIAGISAPSIEFAGSVEPFGYRTTLHMKVDNGRLSLHQPASKDLIQIDTCLIAHERLQNMIESAVLPGATNATLRVSETTGERIAWIEGPLKQPVLPPDVTITTDGKAAAITETVLGREFKVSARSFFQSGRQAAELLATTVDSLVPNDCKWIIDAYAGVGLLGSITASKRNSRITAVESSRSSVKDARTNLEDLEAEVLKAEVATLQRPNTTPDCVIADPSRTGLGKSASKALATLGAPALVLVSCDPASFARDTVLLQNHGYTLQHTKVLDLFPQTHHLECVSLFVR